jgi:asparagine synthase (glutamine-hydrolysing)
MEFCLAVPTEQFLIDGTSRALARRALSDRLPKSVVEEMRSGLQAADWYEQLSSARVEIAQELDRLATCAVSARTLDLPRLVRLVENWPRSGWGTPRVISAYRLVLLRALSAGHFLRRTTTP